MTQQEHLDWAKERALEFCDKSKNTMAWIGFKHDLCKHDDFKDDAAIGFLFSIGDTNVGFVIKSHIETMPELIDPMLSTRPFNIRTFIEGFN